MITDRTLDEALVELLRCQRALEALRKARKELKHDQDTHLIITGHWSDAAEHAAAKRASMDLTRKLAALRAGR